MPTSEDVDVAVPPEATSIEIIETLLDHNLGSRKDNDGNKISYALRQKGKMHDLKEDATIQEEGVQNGDTLLMVPVLHAGDVGKIFFSIPGVLLIGEKAVAKVKISRYALDASIKEDKDFIVEEVEVELIEVSEIMQCTLEENSIRNHIEIIPVTREEQFFGDEGRINWRFDLFPYSIGITSLILKVSITKYFEGLGEKHKDVFIFDKEVLISNNSKGKFFPHKDTEVSLNTVEEIFQWNADKKKEIIGYIQKGENGIALSELANISQKINAEVFNSIIVLQAKLNQVRNRHNLGIIDLQEWLMVSSKVSYATLELLNDLDKSRLVTQDHINLRIQSLNSLF